MPASMCSRIWQWNSPGLPVTRIDGAPIGTGKPGEFTARLTKLYWDKHEDPAWTTPVD